MHFVFYRARVDIHRKENMGMVEKAITIYGQPTNCSDACLQVCPPTLIFSFSVYILDVSCEKRQVTPVFLVSQLAHEARRQGRGQ